MIEGSWHAHSLVLVLATEVTVRLWYAVFMFYVDISTTEICWVLLLYFKKLLCHLSDVLHNFPSVFLLE